MKGFYTTTDIDKPVLYVGCGLTHAPEAFKEEVEQFKQLLGKDWRVARFLGLEAGGPADVYEQDIEQNVRGCDAFVAVADHPATGLGWELGVADERRIPTLIIAHLGAQVSRLIVGAGDAREEIVFERYTSLLEDGPELVEKHLSARFRGKS
jgi:hypothetical protein